MAIAVVATLLTAGVGRTAALIALGVVIGTAVGVPAARSVKMTAMPQMVALFNGVGGGAVALIAWVEFRHQFAARGRPGATVEIASLFAAIIGSISFWGSNIAFGKLQEILPGPADQARRAQQLVNLVLLLAIAVGSRGRAIAAGTHSQALFIVGILRRRGACSGTWSCCRSAAPTCRS